MTQEKISKFQKYRNLARFGVLVYLIVWVICQSGLMFVLFLSPSPPFMHKNIFGRTGMTDFVRIYVAAKLAASEKRHNLYDADAMLGTSQEVLNTKEKPDASDDFTYTPHMCALLAPLSKLPLINAYWTWLAASVTCAAAAMLLILKKERKFDNWTTIVIMLAIFGSINSMTVLLAGQTTLYLLLFFSLLYWGLSRNNNLAAGLGFALSTIKPQYSVLYFVGLISARRWRTLLVFGAVTALMLGYACCQLGWQNVIFYPQILSKACATDEFWYPEKGCNVRAILCYLLPLDVAYKASFLIMLSAAPFVYLLWSTMRENQDRRRWIFALTMLISLTFAPHVNCYDCTLVALPAMLTLPTISPIEIWKIESKPLKYWCFIMISYPSLGWVLGSNNFVFLTLDIALIICGLMHLSGAEMKAAKTQT